MRPRVFPAEDTREPARDDRGRPGFNEAAGIPRGRQTMKIEVLQCDITLQ